MQSNEGLARIICFFVIMEKFKQRFSIETNGGAVDQWGAVDWKRGTKVSRGEYYMTVFHYSKICFDVDR